MASIDKVTASGVIGWLRHNNRCINKDKNADIDPEKSKLNYSLTPYIDIPRDEQSAHRDDIWKLEYAHYRELISHLYVYCRKDVNTLISVVVTLPKELNDSIMEEKFFKGVADFLTHRYGHVVSITVHKDEGKHVFLKDNNGNTVRSWNAGRAHMHFTFIPAVSINHDAVEKKKNPVKAMLKKNENGDYIYKEKVSAKDKIDKKELLSLHPEMNKYLNEVCGIKCNVHSGITREQGGNRSVAELKRDFDTKVIEDLKNEISNLRNINIAQEKKLKEQEKIIKQLERERDLKQEVEISQNNHISSGWEYDLTREEEILW